MVELAAGSLHFLHSRSLGYNAGIVRSAGHACLIDPGLHPDELDGIKAFLTEGRLKVDAVILTHLHWDHVLGPERFQATPVVAQAESVKVAAAYGREIERQVADWEKESGTDRAESFVLPALGQTFKEEQELLVGGARILLVHAPGHAAEHLVVHCPQENWLWAGDMLSDIEIPFVMESLADYQRSLHRIAGMAVDRLVPGHGSPAQGREEVTRRQDGDRCYLYELGSRAARAAETGCSLAEAQELCADIEFANRAQNLEPHRLNVATAFRAAGGDAPPGSTWNRLM